LVVGRYQPLADGDALAHRPTMPVPCSRFRGQREAD